MQAVLQVNAASQVVKSDSATVTVPELEFEIPMGTQKGTITTVEGMLREASEALSVLQPQRAQQDPETAAVIAQFLGEPIAHCPISRSSKHSVWRCSPSQDSQFFLRPKPRPSV